VYKPNSHQLQGYSDKSFALHTDQRSQYGIIICMGDTVSYKTGKIKAACRSSCETEIASINAIVNAMTELGYSGTRKDL
jgi:hypothetical protein